MSDSVGAARSGLRRRRKLLKKSEAFLPDDVVMNILSWLPAKDVLRFRCVCKVWRDFTSTTDFRDLHFRHSLPLVLKKDDKGGTLLDRCWEPAQTRSKIHKLYKPDHGSIVFSHNGLILCSLESAFVIYNPIYRDLVKIRYTSDNIRYTRVCGVFFHPLQKEHCILWRKMLSVSPCKFQYKTLNLESDPKWREICTLNNCFSIIEPLLIDKYLYWIDGCIDDHQAFSHKIMEYDIIQEEFRVIPCPACPAVSESFDPDFSLVDIDGVVSAVQVIHSQESVEINIWTMDDDGEQLRKSSNYIVNSDVYSNYKMSEAIAFRNGELLLQAVIAFQNGELLHPADGWRYKRLYAFNLKFQTFRKFGQTYRDWPEFLPHVTSLVSLKNCKSDICMPDEDENNQPLVRRFEAR